MRENIYLLQLLSYCPLKREYKYNYKTNTNTNTNTKTNTNTCYSLCMQSVRVCAGGNISFTTAELFIARLKGNTNAKEDKYMLVVEGSGRF